MFMKKVSFLSIPFLIILSIFFFNNFFSEEGVNYSEEGVNYSEEGVNYSEHKVIVYKSSSCGCCENYISLLEQKGYKVETIVSSDMASIKKDYGIPSEIESCHTSIFDNYVVEGHVPLEAIDKLLLEKPDVEGIGLAGMPAGSPGMSGIKRESFVVYSFNNYNTSIYWQEKENLEK